MNNNQEIKDVRTTAVLTGSYVAGTVVELFPERYDQCILYLEFTKSSSTSLEFKLEFSDDGTTYYQESAEAISAGTATNRELEHTVVSANQAAAAQGYRIALPLTDRFLKVSFKVTGTVTTTDCTAKVIIGAN